MICLRSTEGFIADLPALKLRTASDVDTYMIELYNCVISRRSYGLGIGLLCRWRCRYEAYWRYHCAQTADSIAALRVLAEQAFGAEFLPSRGNMGHVCRESLSKTCSARDGESHKAGDASYPVLITTDACAFECAHGAQPALHAVQTKPVDGDKLSSADCDERAVAKAAVPLGSSKPKVVALWAKGRLLFKRLPSDEDQAGSTGRRVCLRSTDQAFGMCLRVNILPNTTACPEHAHGHSAKQTCSAAWQSYVTGHCAKCVQNSALCDTTTPLLHFRDIIDAADE
eukprot:126790-Pleurochrysis_carterae.AAC.2